MEKPKMTKKKARVLSVQGMIDAAQDGDWSFVDSSLGQFAEDKDFLKWALEKGLRNPNDNIRDLAATFLDVSDLALTSEEASVVCEVMAVDQYNIVKYRLAIALRKRGLKDPSFLSIINRLLLEAKNDPDVGELARQYQ
jgi:hypothetical protein